MRAVVNEESGEQHFENDLSEADFDVAVDVGPTSSSKRSAIVRRLIEILPMVANDPETMQVLIALIMENLEGEGLSEVHDYFRKKLLKMGVVQPTPEEAQELAQAAANTPPDPNATFLQASAQQAQAQAAKARADTVLTIAKSEETRAKTAETLAGIDRDNREHIVKTVQAISAPLAAPEIPQ
jgi:hypothetical protein